MTVQAGDDAADLVLRPADCTDDAEYTVRWRPRHFTSNEIVPDQSLFGLTNGAPRSPRTLA